ncbi:MAG: hypothetical protein IT265_05060 [Saprospiraceae bacterium]|jgi:rubrerythrin|nr:hypothetical protein [Candidatus Defluviibacterium haderslevense]MCC7026302.1 hypothetical protein [Saprospiraceae bacterium]
MKKHLLIFSLVCISFSTFQCKPKVQEDASRPMIEKKEQSGPEFTSAYICPMHCEGSGSAAPGVCPACGMEYEKNENFKEDSVK